MNKQIVTSGDLLRGFESIELRGSAIIVHASLKSFGLVTGGAKSIVQVLIESVRHGKPVWVKTCDKAICHDCEARRKTLM